MESLSLYFFLLKYTELYPSKTVKGLSLLLQDLGQNKLIVQALATQNDSHSLPHSFC